MRATLASAGREDREGADRVDAVGVLAWLRHEGIFENPARQVFKEL